MERNSTALVLFYADSYHPILFMPVSHDLVNEICGVLLSSLYFWLYYCVTFSNYMALLMGVPSLESFDVEITIWTILTGRKLEN